MSLSKVILSVSEDDPNINYIYMPKHPRDLQYGVVKRTIRLSKLINEYIGPDIYLDVDEKGVLIGMEVLT